MDTATAATIESLREQLEAATSRADSLSSSIIAACEGSGCLNAHELRVALDRERSLAEVLAAEVVAYREWQRTKCDDNASSLDHWHACKALDAATLETDRTNALDAAKFEVKRVKEAMRTQR